MGGSPATRGRVPRRWPARIALWSVAVAVLVTASACSKNSKATVDPSEAAQTIGSAYSLDDSQVSCLKDAFSAHHAATAVLATQSTVSDGDLHALGGVLNGCIPVETLSAAIVGGVSEGFGGLTDTQKQCLDGAIRGLDDNDRDTLLVGLAVSSALDDVQQAQLGKVTNGLLTACSLSLDTTTTG